MNVKSKESKGQIKKKGVSIKKAKKPIEIKRSKKVKGKIKEESESSQEKVRLKSVKEDLPENSNRESPA